MNHVFFSTTLVALTALSMACASRAPEPSAANESALEPAYAGDSCGEYQSNPACNEDFFLRKAWDLSRTDPFEDTAGQVGNASACITLLTAAGAAVAGTTEIPPVSVAAGAVVSAITGIAACKSFANYLHRTGLDANLSCFFEPVLYDAKIAACKCDSECRGGMRNSGQFGDYSPPKAWSAGYLDRFGSANCYCTDDAKEKQCQWHCDNGFASSDPNDCTCR